MNDAPRSASAAVSDARATAPVPSREALLVIAAATVLVVGLAVSFGDPTRQGILMAAVVLAGIMTLVVGANPYAGYLVLVASSIMLVVATTGLGGRGLNAFDAFMLPVLAGTYWGPARRLGRQQDDAATNPARVDVLRAVRKLSGAVLLYFGLAALSLGWFVLRGHPEQAMDSGLKLFRAFQGVLLFPLGMIWLRTEKRVDQAIGALLMGGALFTIVNSLAMSSGEVQRAGQVWFTNEGKWSIGSPIEASTALLMLWVIVLAHHLVRPQVGNLFLLPTIFAMIILTLSRSGMLAWLVFTFLAMGRHRWTMVVVAVALLPIAAPIIPERVWERVTSTLALERGSFDTFSALVRVYGWKAAVSVFLDHPIFGVGYLGFRFFSDEYNDLNLILGTAESLYLEVATGMGILGLFALGLTIVRLYQLGRVVRRHAPAGTRAHQLASFHAPFVSALLIANLTADNFVGMVPLGQIAVWCSLVACAGLASLSREPAP